LAGSAVASWSPADSASSASCRSRRNTHTSTRHVGPGRQLSVVGSTRSDGSLIDQRAEVMQLPPQVCPRLALGRIGPEDAGQALKLTIGFGIFAALVAALVPLGAIVEMVNIGTLFAFILVNAGVMILRRTRPDMPRPFRCQFPTSGARSASSSASTCPWACHG
jgi:hypothetical protein